MFYWVSILSMNFRNETFLEADFTKAISKETAAFVVQKLKEHTPEIGKYFRQQTPTWKLASIRGGKRIFLGGLFHRRQAADVTVTCRIQFHLEK